MSATTSFVDVFSALLTPTIAVFGTIIARQQWKTNRSRLAHELFDRRYAQFDVVRAFIASILREGRVRPAEEQAFLAGTRGIRFTFDASIAQYVDEMLWPMATQLHCLEAELEGVGVSEERSRNVQKQSELKKALNQELRNLEGRFAPYLQLEA